MNTDAIRLTPRESEVVDLVGEGLRAKEVARELGIATNTVTVYISRIAKKLPGDGPPMRRVYHFAQIRDSDDVKSQL